MRLQKMLKIGKAEVYLNIALQKPTLQLLFNFIQFCTCSTFNTADVINLL